MIILMMNKTIAIKVDGMDCTGCAANITTFLQKKGLKGVHVNFSTGDVSYEEDENSISLQEVKTGINKLGYTVVGDDKQPFWTLEQRLVVAAIFTLPLFLSHFFMMTGCLFWKTPGPNLRSVCLFT